MLGRKKLFLEKLRGTDREIVRDGARTRGTAGEGEEEMLLSGLFSVAHRIFPKEKVPGRA